MLECGHCGCCNDNAVVAA
ncbi:hypothetical protein L195_g064448 [Trifolium pratense]|uniref:Uncharacterized protein n=1 Tax=Trifolium pratense TaxID=57577 RepID=A0A2K3KT58_TRIPR|nr:hypothetical protein L195_g064448 [Trifolium pratense]